MGQSLTPMTVLEAMNFMLVNAGEAPVASVDVVQLDAEIAKETLYFWNRNIQNQGWYFNRNDWEYTADIDGFIIVPPEHLRVRPTGNDKNKRAILRQGKLYDLDNNTFQWQPSQKMTVEVVELLDFEDLPQSARNYITLRAAQRYQEQNLGSTVLSGFDADDVMLALSDLKHEEAETGRYNVLDNYTSYITLGRRYTSPRATGSAI